MAYPQSSSGETQGGIYDRRHSLPTVPTTFTAGSEAIFQHERQDREQRHLWPDVFRDWKCVENLRSELGINHSNTIYAWRQLSHQNEYVEDAQRDLSDAIAGIRAGSISDETTIHRVDEAHSKLSFQLREMERLRQELHAFESHRSQLDYEVLMEEARMFRRLEELLGPCPDDLLLQEPPAAVEPSDESSHRPTVLKEYYGAVAWIRVLRDRLDDLRDDHVEWRRARETKFPRARSPSVSDNKSEQRFRDDTVDLLNQISESKKMARDYKQQCLEQELEIVHGPLSFSLGSDRSHTTADTSPSANDHPPEDWQADEPPHGGSPAHALPTHQLEIADQVLAPHQTVSREENSALPVSHQTLLRLQKSTLRSAGCSVKQWALDVWQSREPQQVADESLHNNVYMRSSKSLPDCIIVDTVPAEWRLPVNSEQAAGAALRQKQAQIGMSTKRDFPRLRAFHSDSSLLPSPAHTTDGVIRRSTVHDIGKALKAVGPLLEPLPLPL